MRLVHIFKQRPKHVGSGFQDKLHLAIRVRHEMTRNFLSQGRYRRRGIASQWSVNAIRDSRHNPPRPWRIRPSFVRFNRARNRPKARTLSPALPFFFFSFPNARNLDSDREKFPIAPIHGLLKGVYPNSLLPFRTRV